MPGHDIIVIGGSAGSIEVVGDLVAGLPADLPAALFVVIHFPTSVTSLLPQILNRRSALPAAHALDGEPIRPGRLYVAPTNYHLLLNDGRMRLVAGPKENGHRPAIDPLFRSAARAYGPRVVGIVLSGNLDDGSAGLRVIKQHGGVTVVQDPEQALFPSMPRSAIEHVEVDHVVPPGELPRLLESLAGASAGAPSQPTPIADGVAMSDSAAGASGAGASAAGGSDAAPSESSAIAADRRQQPGRVSTMTCPECHGTLWDADEEGLATYRCRVGHAYSAESLLLHQADALEAALWTALRALEEHAALGRRMAANARDGGRSRVAAIFAERSVDADHQAAMIRAALEGVALPAGVAGAGEE